MKKIVFICTHNSARSQMAEALVNKFHKEKYNAFSARTEKTSVNPYVIKVLSEIGIDTSKHRSKTINEFSQDISSFESKYPIEDLQQQLLMKQGEATSSEKIPVLKVLGILNKTYILAETVGNFLLIDQHAAAE